MPQASDELRSKMADYFGGSGVDDGPPYQYLKFRAWTDHRGMWIAPDGVKISQKEWDCVAFLCDEWDYGYDPALTSRQGI